MGQFKVLAIIGPYGFGGVSLRPRLPLPAAGFRSAFLNRWARHVSKCAKDAAVASLGLENSAAAPAIIKILKGVGRHWFGRTGTPVRTNSSRQQWVGGGRQ